MVLAFLIAATATISLTGADVDVASRFFINNGWPVGERFPWKLLYRLDRYPAILLAVTGLVLALCGLRWANCRPWRIQGAFLVILLALGPGLLVNAIFKDHWGRPRPRDIIQLGGHKQFLQPWQKGIDGDGRSFPSGHASAAFYMTAPFFIYRRRRPRLAHAWLAGGLVFGVFMSIARIAQGGHFLSDNLWAWGMVHLTALILAALLGLDREKA